MLGKILSVSRYMMVLPVVGCLLGSFALIVYELIVIVTALAGVLNQPVIDAKSAKIFSVGLIEGVDIFLIAIAIYIIGVGLYALFIDENVDRPKWLKLRDLEDLKANLVSVVIAVLAVLFLREAIAWDGSQNLLILGASIAAVIASLSLFLLKAGKPPH
jgi:uncharacterized membrane protein YqhA